MRHATVMATLELFWWLDDFEPVAGHRVWALGNYRACDWERNCVAPAFNREAVVIMMAGGETQLPSLVDLAMELGGVK